MKNNTMNQMNKEEIVELMMKSTNHNPYTGMLSKKDNLTAAIDLAKLCKDFADKGQTDEAMGISSEQWEEVIKDPKNCKLPTSSAALCIMAYGAVQRIERSNIAAWFEYLKRTPKELQSVFCLTTAKNEDKKNILMTSASFVSWMRENQYLF